MVFDKYASGAVAFLLQAVTLWLCGGVVICGPNEWDDKVFDSGEELRLALNGEQVWRGRDITYIVYLICSVQLSILNLYWA